MNPFILLSFSKRTFPISLQLEKEIPGAEGLLGLEGAFLLEKDKRTALNARSILNYKRLCPSVCPSVCLSVTSFHHF